MLNQLVEHLPDLPDKNQVWRWGLGAAVGIPAILFVFSMHREDKAYYRTEFIGAVEEAQSSREDGDEMIAAVLAKIAESFDQVGDNIATSTEVQRQQLTQDREQTKETDDLGDEIRVLNRNSERQAKQFDRFIGIIEKHHAGE